MSCSDEDCPYPLSCEGFHGNEMTLFEEEILRECRRSADEFYKANKNDFMIGRGRAFYERGALTSLKRACRCLINGPADDASDEEVREDMAFLTSKFPDFPLVAALFGWHWVGFATAEDRELLHTFLMPFNEEHLNNLYCCDRDITDPKLSLFRGVITPRYNGNGHICYGVAEKLIRTCMLDVYTCVLLAGQFSKQECTKLIALIRTLLSPDARADIRARVGLEIPKRSMFHDYYF